MFTATNGAPAASLESKEKIFDSPPRTIITRVPWSANVGIDHAGKARDKAYYHTPITYGNEMTRFPMVLLDMVIQELSEQMKRGVVFQINSDEILRCANRLHAIAYDGQPTSLQPRLGEQATQAIPADKPQQRATYSWSIDPEEENATDARHECVRRSLQSEDTHVRVSSVAPQVRGSEKPKNASVRQSSLTGKSSVVQGRSTMVNLFSELDQDGSGALSTDELRAAVVACGVSKARAQRMLNRADKDGSGEIDFQEWKEAVLQGDDEEFAKISSDLSGRIKAGLSALYEEDTPNARTYCMLRPNSKYRLIWDSYLSACCLYVAIAVPFTNGFESLIHRELLESLFKVELVIDISFLLDVCLNFRTGFVRKDGTIEFDWRFVARAYLSSWFFLDLVSSLPFDAFSSGEISSPRVLKVLKIPKIARALRVLGPMMISRQDQMLRLDEILMAPLTRALLRRAGMILATVLLCHWLACCMGFCSISWITNYLISKEIVPTLWSAYLAAAYWAMTTMSTVGWGDIIPATDLERVYTMFAMLVGGVYYGVAMGTLVSMVERSGLNKNAFHERMDVVFAWLDHHHLPAEVRRRVISYFRAYLTEQSVAFDEEVVGKLAPALRAEVAALVIHKDIRDNPFFDYVPMAALSRIQSFLKKVSFQLGDTIVTDGEPGVAMYIIHQGTASLERNDYTGIRVSSRSLSDGDSFGEEILTGLTEQYEYTVVAVSAVSLFMLEEEEFHQAFAFMPDVMAQFHNNATSIYLAATRDQVSSTI